jgi:hypothetical protein
MPTEAEKFEYRLVEEKGIPLDDDQEDHETPQDWLERWRTEEGWPTARLQRRVIAPSDWEDVPDAD